MHADPRSHKSPEAQPRSTGWQQRAEQEFSQEATPPADAFRSALHQVGELKEIAAYYIAAKADSLRLSVRTILVYAVLGVLGVFLGSAALVTAVVLLLTGLSGAIGTLFNPDRAWAGALIVSVAILALVVVGALIGIKRLTGSGRKKTVQKYESRQQDQRSRFGHSVPDLAAHQQQYGNAAADK